VSGNGIALFVALLTVLVAQPPQRDAGGLPPIGTAVIAGRVVSEDAVPHPVRRAIVTIAGDVPAGRSAITDDEGRFTFTSLPAGQFTITARKAAYLPGAYGAARAGRPGTPLTLIAGQKADVLIRMNRGAVVTGIVRDETGQPLPGIPVAAVRVPGSGPIETLFNNAEYATSDDRGVYRVFGLAPGEYVVAGLPRLPGSGEIRGWTAGTMDSLLRSLEQRTGRGNAGTPLTPGTSDETTGRGLSYGFVPTYFPGSPVFTSASRLRLAAGEERAGIDFPVTAVPAAAISGAITGGGVSLGAVQMSIVIGGPRMAPMMGSYPVLSRRPGTDGEFTYTGVAPGHYTIIARVNRGQTVAEQPVAAGRMGAGGGLSGVTPPGATSPAPGETLYAVADVDVAGTDLAGVTLALQPGATFSGRIAFDPASTQPRLDLAKTRINLASPFGTGYTMTANTIIGNTFSAVPPLQIRADGTFSASGIAPGTYLIRTTLPGDAAAGWWLSSAIVNGRDALDFPLEIALGRDVADAVLTFSDRRTELNGTLEAASGQPAPEHFVIAFAADRAYWTPMSRRITSVRPATDGRFSIRDLPPGEYLLAALTDLDPDDWRDPAFLGQVAPAAIRVSLSAGQPATQNLRITR
jgi:hypothetical protein